MKYMGSKARHAKELLPIILNDRLPGQLYVEPFVGGANMIDKVAGNRLGADINEYLICMWNAIKDGWEPPEYVDKEEYAYIRDNKDKFDKHLVGWVAHCCSYNGKWFGGFAGKIIPKAGKPRNYQTEARNAVMKQRSSIIDVPLIAVGYDKIVLDEPSIIYCDPPYRNTTKYKDEFDHEAFYVWCKSMASMGHKIFVSEYEMPEEFVCIWSKVVNNSLTADTGSKQATEKLFKLI